MIGVASGLDQKLSYYIRDQLERIPKGVGERKVQPLRETSCEGEGLGPCVSERYGRNSFFWRRTRG